jgi:hypothetical protein
MMCTSVGRGAAKRVSAVLVTAVLLTVAGCDSGSDGDTAPPSARATTVAATAAVGAAPATAGAAPATSGKVLASRAGSFDRAEFRIDVVEFARNVNFVNLTFTATLTKADAPLGWQVNNAFSAVAKVHPNVDGVFLIDAANAKKHLVALDSEGGCVCTRIDGLFLKEGQSATFSATFAAPPAGVAAMDVHIPNVGTLANVPLG